MQNGRRRYVDFHEYKRRHEELKLEANSIATEIMDLNGAVGSRRSRMEMAFGEAFEQLVGIALMLSKPEEEILWQFALSPTFNDGEVEAVHNVVDYVVGDECYEAGMHLSNKKLDQVYKQLIAVRRGKNSRVSKYGKLNVVVLKKPGYTNNIWSRVWRDINVIELREVVDGDISLIGEFLENKQIDPTSAERLSVILYNLCCDAGEGKRDDVLTKIKYIARELNTRISVERYESVFGELRHKTVPRGTCFYEDGGETKKTAIFNRLYQYPQDKIDILKAWWESLGEEADEFEMTPEKLKKIKKHLEGLLRKDSFYQSLDEETFVCEEKENNGIITLEYSTFGVPLAMAIEYKIGGWEDIEAISYNPDNGVVRVMHKNGTERYSRIDPKQLTFDLVDSGFIVRGDFSELFKRPGLEKVDPLLIDRTLYVPESKIKREDGFYEKLKTYIMANLN